MRRAVLRGGTWEEGYEMERDAGLCAKDGIIGRLGADVQAQIDGHCTKGQSLNDIVEFLFKMCPGMQ